MTSGNHTIKKHHRSPPPLHQSHKYAVPQRNVSSTAPHRDLTLQQLRNHDLSLVPSLPLLRLNEILQYTSSLTPPHLLKRTIKDVNILQTNPRLSHNQETPKLSI
ncbi:hypothetical protein KC19_5G095500 [Ceratodon purpureus]|uniref:Uncharacterized protein n=1 Tax=Ceratodon purpureus TaxID=3225 RepID=A0A8T0I0G8_CERPU|nr:hypothetical protein KC19_5G095500 [Ceratodon purpureus]